MATSGSISVAVTSWDTLKFTWTLQSQSLDQNTSTVSWELQLIAGSDGYISSSTLKSYSVTIGSKAVTGSTYVSISNNATKVLARGTFTLLHDAEGVGVFGVYFSQEFGITFQNSYIGTVKGSGKIELPSLLGASQPSLITWPESTADVGDFGDTISIHMNRQSDTYTHTVRYAFGSLTGTIATDVATGTTWTIPLSFMDLLPAATKGSGRIYVDTYSGGSFVGTRYTGFTAHVPATVKPTCSIQVLDATDTKDTYGDLVKGLSKLYVKVSGTPAYKSPIAAYSATANGLRYSAAEFTTDVLTAAGTTTVSATVTDKRGRVSAAKSASFTVLDYNKPSITALSVRRCDADGTENPQGEYVQATFSARVTALNNKNSAKYKIRYKRTTASSFTEVTLTALAGKYTINNSTYVFAADSSGSFDVEVEVTDDIASTVRSTTASTAFTLMNWGTNGTSMAIGKVAEKSNAFEIGVRAYDQYGGHISNGMSLYGGTSNHIDADTTIEHLILTAKNTPDTSLWYVETIFYSTKSVTSDRRQTAMPYRRGGPTFSRYYTGDVWSAWESALLAAWPVGSIYLAYNHTNPATLFGGTWARITESFLWAISDGGTIGQTGGAKEVTLTTDQIPVHDHGGTYTNKGTSRTHAWLTANGSAMGYDTVSTGGGKAHNNMPPYIQVSVWRRTA